MPDTAVYLLSAKNTGINSSAQEIEAELKRVVS
jgi:hypothetical protein